MKHKINLIQNGLNIKVITSDTVYLTALNDFLSAQVPGCEHSPKFKSGSWNGFYYFLHRNEFPYGLLAYVLEFTNNNFSQNELIIDDSVKSYYSPFKYDLSTIKYDYTPFTLADHQINCINAGLRYKKGIILSATASGKSAIIYTILRNLYDSNIIKKFLIIVPTILLVEQLEENFREYGFKGEIGLIGDKLNKNWNADIVISTWQSASLNLEKVKDFQSIFIDEAQISQSEEVSKVLKGLSNAIYRLGFTGTLQSSDYEVMSVKSYLGPVLITVTTKYLMSIGWLSKCIIKRKEVYHSKNVLVNKDMNYNDIISKIFPEQLRLYCIEKIIKNTKENAVLILVNKIEDEGDILETFLKTRFPNKKVGFVHGKTKKPIRKELLEISKKENSNLVLIATYPLFQAGVDIPILENIILASPAKGKIRILQTIGRGLRKHKNKVEAKIYDIIDIVNGTLIFEKQSGIKERLYENEGFEIETEQIKEEELLHSSSHDAKDFF